VPRDGNEYRYSSYQSADLEILATPPVPPTGLAQHMRNQVQTLATELVYKLNWTP
jgi:hypothetical protein